MGDKYKLLVGLTYPRGVGEEEQVPAGTVVDDIPEDSVGWLLEQCCIEPVEGKKKPKKEGA